MEVVRPRLVARGLVIKLTCQLQPCHKAEHNARVLSRLHYWVASRKNEMESQERQTDCHVAVDVHTVGRRLRGVARFVRPQVGRPRSGLLHWTRRNCVGWEFSYTTVANQKLTAQQRMTAIQGGMLVCNMAFSSCELLLICVVSTPL